MVSQGTLITEANIAKYLATASGDYTVTTNVSTCRNNSCCPIYIKDFYDCPSIICILFLLIKSPQISNELK